MSRSDRLEAKDPFLAGYKKSLQDVIKGMKKVGPTGLQLLIQEMIRSRWIKDRRASYPYEVAWVFDRREESISGIMKKLEEEGNIEPQDWDEGRKARPNHTNLELSDFRNRQSRDRQDLRKTSSRERAWVQTIEYPSLDLLWYHLLCLVDLIRVNLDVFFICDLT